MDRRAILKAESRLRNARAAIEQLETSKTYQNFADSWYVFLVSTKSVYTALQQGAKISPQSMQWLGAKKRTRKSDPLLQYLFEARNDDEHGLNESVNLQPERHELGLSGKDYSRVVRVDGGPNFYGNVFVGCETAVVIDGPLPPSGVRVTSLDAKPVRSRHTPAKPTLVAVTGRGNVKYPPPTSHEGIPIADVSPLGVAKLAMSYMEALVKEASGLK